MSVSDVHKPTRLHHSFLLQNNNNNKYFRKACPHGALSALQCAWPVSPTGPGGSEFNSGPQRLVSVCRSTKCIEWDNISGKHRRFSGVLFNLWRLANAGFRDAQYLSLLEPLITDGVLLYVLVGHQRLCSHAPLSCTLGPTAWGARELRPSIMH